MAPSGRARALDPKANPFEKKKNAKGGDMMWTEVFELAALLKTGTVAWDELDLDDVDVRLKWVGMFHRRKRTPGRFMMRVRVPNGELTAAQLRVLGECIAPFGADGCADITTRAGVQLRGLTLDDADRVLNLLRSVSLTSFMSGMDNVRQVTGSPIAGVDPHEVTDTRPLAHAVDAMITGNGAGNLALSNLPRKLNISFSASRDDFVHSHINDLAFEAAVDPASGEVGWNVLVSVGEVEKRREGKRGNGRRRARAAATPWTPPPPSHAPDLARARRGHLKARPSRACQGRGRQDAVASRDAAAAPSPSLHLSHSTPTLFPFSFRSAATCP